MSLLMRDWFSPRSRSLQAQIGYSGLKIKVGMEDRVSSGLLTDSRVRLDNVANVIP